jgi:plasmid stabilization system protein ParE
MSLIWNYAAEEWSEKQADNYNNLLLLACQELAENPSHGKHYEILATE